ncbi:MAG TPA: hypothetical protein VK966_02285 [Longimicrobiales bacterium]|nr:hypothetical protein [Longimicrobiales bacterium]
MKRPASRLTLFGAVALLAAVSAAAASPTRVAAQEPLGEVLSAIADHWEEGDARAIGSYVSRRGTRLEVGGMATGGLDGRKLVGALRRIFDDRVTVSVVSNMSRAVQGAEDRAFGELVWRVRRQGATVPETSVVFLALVRERAGWRLTQIRVLDR